MTVFPIILPQGAPVLIAGAGGGFDFMCGLPIALELEERGHPVVLASYSFSRLSDAHGVAWVSPHLAEVTADCTLDDEYFPERDVSAWYRSHRGVEQSVWCFRKEAVPATRAGLQLLVERFKIDTVISVDGGIDGIFRGDECDLATPSMDAVSVIAASLCSAPRRLYATTAFGVEGAEGTVSHGQALERMADLVRADAMLGVGAFIRNTEVGLEYLDAVRFVFERMSPVRRSVIVSAITAAMGGAFGRTVVHPKTEERPPWLSPLTQLVWYFDADAVARMKLYYDEASSAASLKEVADAIARAREAAGAKPGEPIPL